MPDVQILSGAVADVPMTYEVPAAAEFTLKTVYAFYVDNGAAGSWIPCLTIRSDSGHIVAQAVDQSNVVGAGDDADVSWFPGVKRGGAASTGVVDYLLLQGVAQTVLDPPVGDSDHAKFNAGTAQSNSLGSWTLVLDGAGNVKEVDTTVRGRYQSVCNFEWDDPVAATDLAVIANMFGAGPISMSPSWLVRRQTTDVDGFTQAFSNLPSGTLQMTIEPSISSGDATLGFDAFYWWILRFPL
jgi:hypothetical protein